MNEHASGQLRGRVVENICAWCKKGAEEGSEADAYLEVADIREQLAREGMEPHSDALTEVLAKLAEDGDITLAIGDTGATVYRTPRSKLCEGQAGE